MSLSMPSVQVRMAPMLKQPARARQSSHSREEDLESRVLAGLAFHANGTLMLQDDASRDGQAQARATGFGGEERLQQARHILRRDPGARVLYRKPELGPVHRVASLAGVGVRRAGLRSNKERAIRPQGLDRVQEEVHERLLQLVVIPLEKVRGGLE